MFLRRRPRASDGITDIAKPGTNSFNHEISPSKMDVPIGTGRRRHLLRFVLSHFIVAVVMATFGWLLHGSFMTSSYRARIVKDPPWWLADDVDDFFSRTYVNGLPAVRQLNVSSFFTGMCGRYRFDESIMPTASIIVTVQNEHDGMLTLTVQTLLARTPPNLLHEIVIVDDNGLGDIRGPVNETEFEELRVLSPKIKIITNQYREGVPRCRMKGVRATHGDVLVFVDSHIEMLSGTWLQHLLLPIVENPDTLAAQTLDVMSDLDWTYGPGSGDLLYGVITDEFWFGYQRSRFGGPSGDGTEQEAPGRRLPYETPFVPGSLFGIRRDVFMRLGGYDEGMYVWGGENTDLAIKMWACGGRVMMVPCSRVGHMYRIHIDKTGRWPPDISTEVTDKLGLGKDAPFMVNDVPADNFTKIITRNNIRVLERWAKTSNARTGYYAKVFGNSSLSEEWQSFAEEMKTDAFALQQEWSIKRNGCKNFDWFDKHVYVKLTGVHHPWHPDTTERTWV